MLNDTTLSLILFRWAIFCLLSYKCYQLVRQYALPWFREAMRQEQNLLSELVNKDKLAMIAKQKVENQLHNQHKLLATLEDNVRRWHTSLLVEKAIIEQAEQGYAMLQQKKHAQQREQLFLAQSIAAVVPQALEQAEIALIQNHTNITHFNRVLEELKPTAGKPA